MSQHQTRSTRPSTGHSNPESAPAKRHGGTSPLSLRVPGVQTKLSVNDPGDRFEEEADTVADAVMRAPLADAPGIQRQEQPEDDSVQLQEQPDEAMLQRDGDGKPGVSPQTAATIRAPGGGDSLSASTRSRIEPHVGADLSNVQVHSDAPAAEAASSLQARAFTYNNHIFLNSAESTSDVQLMAHESAHVVQQGGVLRRQPEVGLQGRKIEKYGIAYKKEGVNLRDQPASNPNSKVLTRLQFNTRMYVDSVVSGYYFVGTDNGQFGYVATSHVNTNLPEPDAKIYHIEAGDTALGISRQHYGGESKWGRDHRFFVNGLVHVNDGDGNRGIYKPDSQADWDMTQVRAGYMIWVPSLKFMRSLQGVVKSGSITYEAWQTVKNIASAVGEFLLGTGAFVVGLLHGALESVWDIFVGLKDLAVMAIDLIKWLFGFITGDSKGLFDSLKDINWSELVKGWIDGFDAKWNHESILKRWHFRGWVIGYAIAEVLMLIFSAGIIQGIKWAGKAAKVAGVISKLPKIAKLGEAAKTSKIGQKFSKTLKAVQGTSISAKAASKFVFNLLKKPTSIWGKGPDEIADMFRKAGYKVTVEQSKRGSKLSKQIRISNPPKGAPKIDRIQIHPGGGRHGGSYYKISSSDPSFGTKWVADKATFKVLPGMDLSKIIWAETGLEGWLLRAAVANAAVQRGRRED